MQLMKIGIITPTRGLAFSKTLEAIERERQGYDVTLYLSSDLIIPDGHNQLTYRALEEGCDYLLFIEEDVVMPTRALEKLLAAQSEIACIDYGVSSWSCIAKDQSGEILWCGLGCTLIKRTVFESLERPYFRVDMVLDLPQFRWRQLPASYIEKRNYGSLDIWFFTKAREKGFKIVQVDGECDHLQLVALGQRERNNGVHEIALKPRILKHQVIERG